VAQCTVKESSELPENVGPQIVDHDVGLDLVGQAQHIYLCVVPEVLVPVRQLVKIEIRFHVVYEGRRYRRFTLWHKSLKE